ncbi:cytochrome P450 [Truncatella angustata]|uniref:Cytochrome P450 n=1 Tax=Truncatella angustata TaxID=152316 RepID=A0A9P9A0X1_9PEZI|nr:cytochrome P450 [Truncatella angustata]KAH6657514.1 cytochrome P450 [Truncatella angustata]
MDITQTRHNIIAERWPVILAALLVVLLAGVYPYALRAVQIARIPTIGTELGGVDKRRQAYIASARQLYNDGYRKFKNGVFQITTPRNTTVVVLSPKYLPEIKKLPDSILSMDASVVETIEAKYTKIEPTVPIVPHTVKAELTPALVRLNPTIAQEVRESMALEFPPCSEWTPINIHHKLLRIVAMVSGRIFIGPELCRDERYLDAAINYTIEVMTAQRAVVQMHPWLRPFFAARLPEIKKLEKRKQEAYEFLGPMIDARRQAWNQAKNDGPDDMLQWLLTNQPKFPDEHSQNLVEVQLGLSFAAIHTTVLVATNVFYSAAALPELMPELREEIEEALAQNDGIFTSKALQAMTKLDSFLKETLRVYPATMASFQRKVLRTFTLLDGRVIPAGVTIEIPATAISSDPDVFPNADQYDPLRFYKMRQQAKESSNESGALNQFVSVSANSLNFGYGRHACPGRFFAANEIKMIFANALMKYDFKLANGETERYPNMEFAHMSIPNPSKEILLKQR